MLASIVFPPLLGEEIEESFDRVRRWVIRCAIFKKVKFN